MLDAGFRTVPLNYVKDIFSRKAVFIQVLRSTNIKITSKDMVSSAISINAARADKGFVIIFYYIPAMIYSRRTSFSDPKGYFGKIIKLLGNNLFLCIAHFRTIFGQYV